MLACVTEVKKPKSYVVTNKNFVCSIYNITSSICDYGIPFRFTFSLFPFGRSGRQTECWFRLGSSSWTTNLLCHPRSKSIHFLRFYFFIDPDDGNQDLLGILVLDVVLDDFDCCDDDPPDDNDI